MKTNYRKAWLLVVLMCIIGAFTATSQSRISAVYGVNLGDSESTVTAKISGSWKTNSKGERYYRVSRPTLGSCQFEQATFRFKSGKLSIVSFTSSDGGAMDPNFQYGNGAPNGYEQFLAKSERFQKMYRAMYADLSGKYGSPVLDDGERAVWKSNGNMIELKYSFEDTTNNYGWHDGFTSILVKYSVATTESSNF